MVLAICIFLYSRHWQGGVSQAESAKATAASTIPAIEPAAAASAGPNPLSSVVPAVSANPQQLPAAISASNVAVSHSPAPKKGRIGNFTPFTPRPIGESKSRKIPIFTWEKARQCRWFLSL